MKNILLIGLGSIGKIHHKNLIRFKKFNIFVFDIDKNVTLDFIDRKIQNDTNFEDILKNNTIDAAIIRAK